MHLWSTNPLKRKYFILFWQKRVFYACYNDNVKELLASEQADKSHVLLLQSGDIIALVGALCAFLGQADLEYKLLLPLLAAAGDNIFLQHTIILIAHPFVQETIDFLCFHPRQSHLISLIPFAFVTFLEHGACAQAPVIGNLYSGARAGVRIESK